jgi:hypothetical protein
MAKAPGPARRARPGDLRRDRRARAVPGLILTLSRRRRNGGRAAAAAGLVTLGLTDRDWRDSQAVSLKVIITAATVTVHPASAAWHCTSP